MDILHAAAASGSAFLAGAINSVAGGGTLVSFPTLIWLGLDSVTANATSTVAIWPGAIGSTWGYRRELQKAERRFRILLIPSLIGGITGAMLLKLTPASTFDRLVPFLVLFATLLFAVQEPIHRRLKMTAKMPGHASTQWLIGAILFQLAVGVYGGYFGAGIGILMLAALSIIGLTDIHEMNSLKVVFGGTINGIAAGYFVWSGMVYWQDVVVMAFGAILGGWGGAGTARRIGRTAVRRIIIGIGFGMALSLFIKK